MVICVACTVRNMTIYVYYTLLFCTSRLEHILQHRIICPIAPSRYNQICLANTVVIMMQFPINIIHNHFFKSIGQQNYKIHQTLITANKLPHNENKLKQCQRLEPATNKKEPTKWNATHMKPQIIRLKLQIITLPVAKLLFNSH